MTEQHSNLEKDFEKDFENV
jgi:hypothetical protein